MHDAQPVPDGQLRMTSAFLTPDLLSRVVTYAFNGSTTSPTARRRRASSRTSSRRSALSVQYPHVPANTRLLGGAPFSQGPTPTASTAVRPRRLSPDAPRPAGDDGDRGAPAAARRRPRGAARGGRGGLRAAPRADHRDGHARRAREPDLAGHRGPPPALRRRRDLRARPRAGLRPRADRGPRAPAPARGLPVRQPADRGEGHRRRRAGRAGAWPRRRPVQVVFGPARSSTRPSARSRTSSRAQTQQRDGAGRAGGGRGARARAAPGALARRRRSAGARREPARLRAGAAGDRQARRPVRAQRASRSLDDPSFVAHVVFASSAAPGTPKARFAYLFPNRDSALVQVRLRPGLSSADRAQATRRRARGRRDAAVAAGQGRATRSPARPSSCRTSRPRSRARS